ncbi:hypothetical protein C8R48DRAFT_113246 [Suillus tomentosus]|nr:hypothetical protein C8R48DRAFT_113246 [Suillus tomentosus]
MSLDKRDRERSASLRGIARRLRCRDRRVCVSCGGACYALEGVAVGGFCICGVVWESYVEREPAGEISVLMVSVGHTFRFFYLSVWRRLRPSRRVGCRL